MFPHVGFFLVLVARMVLVACGPQSEGDWRSLTKPGLSVASYVSHWFFILDVYLFKKGLPCCGQSL